MDGFNLELRFSCWRPLPARWSRACPASPSGWSRPRSGSTSSRPLQTATLIIAFGLIVQGYAVWKLRSSLDWTRLWPFVLGAAIGVPVGVADPDLANPAHVRIGVGVFLVLYSLYALFRPAIPPVKAASPVLDAGVGFLNGVLGGMTGLAGILVTIWCGLRGWPKDVQRTVFQPVAVAIFLMSALWIGATRRHHAGRHQAVSGRIACPARRHLARLEAVRPARRGCVPQGRAGAAAGVGCGAGHLSKPMRADGQRKFEFRTPEQIASCRLVIPSRCAGDCRCQRTGWKVPYGADQTVYLVVDRVESAGRRVLRNRDRADRHRNHRHRPPRRTISTTRSASPPSTPSNIGHTTSPGISPPKSRPVATSRAPPCPGMSRTSFTSHTDSVPQHPSFRRPGHSPASRAAR